MTGRPKLPKAENLLLIFVLKNAPVEPKAKTYSYRFVGRSVDQFVAAAVVKGERDLHLVFTLGSSSPHAFMTVTDGDPQRVAAILAQAEDYDANVSRLGVGDTLALQDPYMVENLREALLLVRPSVSNALKGFPESAEIGGRAYHFMVAVFLDHVELELKQHQGLAALFEKFEADDKDLARLSARLH